jgi:leader peptidase (prepilin peptidase) / N-methyltransferase
LAQSPWAQSLGAQIPDLGIIWQELTMLLLAAIMGIILASIARAYRADGMFWHGWHLQQWGKAGAFSLNTMALMSALLSIIILWSATHSAASPLHLALLLVTGWLLLLASLVDFLILQLPRLLNISIGVLGLAEALLTPRLPALNTSDIAAFLHISPLGDRLTGACIAFIGLMLVQTCYQRLRQRTGIGLGDIWLSAAIACWIGWQALPWLLFGASMSALFAISGYTLMHRKIYAQSHATHRFAFGPWLALAGWGLICWQRV